MNNFKVIDTLRQIAQPVPFVLSPDRNEIESDSDTARAAHATLVECGWPIAALCVSASRIDGLIESVTKMFHPNAAVGLPLTWLEFAAGIAIGSIVGVSPPDSQPADAQAIASAIDSAAERAAAAEQTAAAGLTADSAPPGPENTLAWAHYVIANLRIHNGSPFCDAVSSGYIPAEIGYVLAAGIAACIAVADTSAGICQLLQSGRDAQRDDIVAVDGGVTAATRAMFETMVEAVAGAVAVGAELSLPPVIV